jgi:hypothetical protein
MHPKIKLNKANPSQMLQRKKTEVLHEEVTNNEVEEVRKKMEKVEIERKMNLNGIPLLNLEDLSNLVKLTISLIYLDFLFQSKKLRLLINFFQEK